MDWNRPILGFTLALVLVLSGITLLMLDDDATVDPFEEDASGPLEDQPQEEDEAFDTSWWLGLGAVVVGVVVGAWGWWTTDRFHRG